MVIVGYNESLFFVGFINSGKFFINILFIV